MNITAVMALDRFQLLEHAWDYDYENRSNIVDSYVRLLRKKVDKPFGTASIETFMRRPGEVLSRFQLLEHAWDYDYENRSNVVDSYIRLLRRKIDRRFGADSFETVRGAGYRLREGSAT